MTQPESDPGPRLTAGFLTRKGATPFVAPFDGACPNLSACWQLARMNGRELRHLAGFSPRTGKINRLALRMRRAGAIIRAHPELIQVLTGLPLKDILDRAEAVGKGSRYSY